MLIGQLIFDGMAMGLVFVILATGLVLITSVNKILFFAYGAFYTIGAYGVWYAMRLFDLPYFISLLLGILCSAALGVLSYLLIFRRLQFMERGFLATLIASMGLFKFLSQGGLLVFGTVPRSIPSVFEGNLNFMGINITSDKVAIIVIGVVITVILFLVYEKTAIGRSMRAVTISPEAAALQGVDINSIYMMTLGMGTGLAGIAGGILAPTYGINPLMGANILWTVMLMAMLGGMDSLLGAVVGGIVIGQLLSFGQYYIGGAIQIIIFLIIGVVLYFKPAGLLGRGIDIGI